MSGLWLKTAFVVHFSVVLCSLEPARSGTERGGWNSSDYDATNLILHTSDTVFHLITAPLDYTQAKRFCLVQFSTLATVGQQEAENGSLQLLREAGLRKPVWVRDPNQPIRSEPAVSKQYMHLPALTFPRDSRGGFARVQLRFPPLPAVTVCVRVQWDQRHNQVSTVFSYAAPVFTNEFQLRGRADGAGRVLVALIVHGHHRPYKASFSNDGAWHHLCVTWRRSDGRWAIHVDGERRDTGAGADTPRDIHGEGIFIVGQDQDSFGGDFTEPFVGNVTDLRIWDVALEEAKVQDLYACSAPAREPLFTWSIANMTLHPGAKLVPVQLLCSANLKQQVEYCQALETSSSGQLYHLINLPCSQSLPFICMTSRERFLKVNELKGVQPSPFMNHLVQLSNGTLQPEGLVPAHPEQLTWGQVSHLLQVSKQALEESSADLEPSDMLHLVQMLAHVADVPMHPNNSHLSVTALSRHFITVADRMVSEENAPKWQAIKQVVNGPMAVVESIDRMVSNLHPMLLAESGGLVIQSDNIKLQVHQRSLGDGTGASEFCGPHNENDTVMDCISVPSHNIQTLHDNGFQKVTVMNVWYGSLLPLFHTQGNVTLFPAVSDGTHKYKGAVLGSSLISSTVLGDSRPISMAIQFQLQHRPQNPPGTVYDPVCAYWDFSLMPEAGGGWSTVGCEVISKGQGSTSCHCNHTTNFALLLQIYEVKRTPVEESALQMLTFIGCGISLCGLTFTFILFIAVGVPKSDRNTVHKNLIVALAVAELLLMCSDAASAQQEVCLGVTAALHLFFMASFTWMLVEGLLLWSKVVSVNMSEDRRMGLYYSIGWGVPIVIVAVTLTVSFHKYKADNYCWLNVKTDIIWAFVGPVLFVLAVNAVVLCRVVMVTVSSARRRAKMLTPSSSSQLHALDLTWAATRPVLILLPVLGLTWLCGVLVHLSMVLAYLFIALNAFQGLYIFLVYAVYNSEVRNAIRRIKEKRKALSFTNCSQPIGFLPSQRTATSSWTNSVPMPSSPETSDTSAPGSTSCGSLVIKNESFRKESFVSFSTKHPTTENQVVQLTAFKPSGC
ncbi:adhesion G-protein coupled receptor D2 [Megalops cyprinoides]|uniref:adhesion G-protein coupled receptor D2 n=1 Tax=Megalops cyprinoides TaxID=118141 RepID=UPI0018640658|nr:adhesion G-protein coupled receptor D2 [Megalops cyprinoides]